MTTTTTRHRPRARTPDHQREEEYPADERTRSLLAGLAPHTPDPRWRGYPEAELLRSLLTAARHLGWLAYHTHDSRRSPAGFPDLVLLNPPHLWLVELKTERGEPTPEQVLWLHRLDRCRQPPRALLWRPSNLHEALEALANPSRLSPAPTTTMTTTTHPEETNR